MATAPAFISTPRISYAALTTGNTSRAATSTYTTIPQVIAAAAAGTRILEIVVKATAQPADSCIVLWTDDGTDSHPFDEIDLGAPAAASNTVVSYRTSLTYQNLILPSGWGLRASVTVTPTSGSIFVYALGGDLT